MKAIIISNGSVLKSDLFYKLYDKDDFIICADGGLNYLDKINIKPNLIVGDLDSVDKSILKKYNDIEIHKFNPEKDFTDTELAVDEAVKKGYEEIILVCATGVRLDHSMANIMLIEKYYYNNVIIKIIDNNNIIQPLKNNMTVDYDKNTFISIIPLSEVIDGLNLTGFKYSLKNAVVHRGSTLCISNEVVKKNAKISYKNGIGLLFISMD